MDIFNTREIAISIWIIIGLILLASFSKGRKSLYHLVKAATQWQLVILYFSIFIYCGIIIYALYQWNFWQCSFLKDTILWVVLSGIGMLIRHNQKNGFKNHLKDCFRDAISVTAIVVFVSSARTFNIWLEFISVPFLVIFGGAQAYAESNQRPNCMRVAKFLKSLLVAYGLVVIAFSLHGVIRDYQEFFTTETLRSFLLPIVLLIAFVPFYYAFALYSMYESVFIQLKWPTRNEPSLVKYLTRKLCKYVGINLFRIERFCQYRSYANPFFKEKEDIDRFFDWIVCKDIEKIVQKHSELGIDELPWDAVIEVMMKDGSVITGEYGHWTNAFHNEPKGESIYVMNDQVENELYVDEIIAIKQIGSYSP